MNATVKPFADVIALANTIVRHTLERGGGTFDFDGKALDPPFYVVGGVGEAIKLTIYDDQDNQGIVDRLAAYLQRQPSRGGSKPLIGAWLYNQTIYIDNVDIHTTYVGAIANAFQRDQIAIWDGAKGETIFLVNR
jgi:hypothetical protein